MRIIEWKKKKKKTNEKYRERQTKEKEKEKLKQDGCSHANGFFWSTPLALVVPPIIFPHHLLLGNCHVHTTSLLQLYSPVATISHWTLFSSSTDSVFLSLFISSTLTTWTASSRSSLFSYSILCVNSLFFVYLFIKFWFVFIFCLIDGKTVEKEEKGQIYFLVFLRFPVLFLIFSSCSSCDYQIKNISLK